jgi:hypothetical protein
MFGLLKSGKLSHPRRSKYCDLREKLSSAYLMHRVFKGGHSTLLRVITSIILHIMYKAEPAYINIFIGKTGKDMISDYVI